VLDINAVIYGLIYLFYEPNPDDPLNKEAAQLYREDIKSCASPCFATSLEKESLPRAPQPP
jgi:ubiquitin-protein ligase